LIRDEARVVVVGRVVVLIMFIESGHDAEVDGWDYWIRLMFFMIRISVLILCSRVGLFGLRFVGESKVNHRGKKRRNKKNV
jgi:hypothetical protein